jgi:hypothetical protein
MNFFIKELATVNLFLIFLIIFAGFVLLKIVKRKLEY